MSAARRRLAGIGEVVPVDQASPYHAVAREAALAAFGRAVEQGDAPAGPDDTAPDAEPEYLVASAADGELLVIAGVWAGAAQSCGRLVAPRALLALLLDDPSTTAVWCDEDDGEGIALTGYAIDVRGRPFLLVAARSARVTGETAGVADVAYADARLAGGAWTPEALEAFLREHDGDAVALSPAMVDELTEHLAADDDEA